MRLDGERRGEKGCGQRYHEQREAEMGRRWNVKAFLSYVSKDACFPSKCDDRIKIKTSSSDIKLPGVVIVF